MLEKPAEKRMKDAWHGMCGESAETSVSADLPTLVERLRAEEFSRLGDRVYVDHAGAALYSEAQLQEACRDMASDLYTNPHSQHMHQADYEGVARTLTLRMCRASPAEYDCIFTSGATGAIRTVAEAFPWAPGSCFAYTRDNHTSVVGVRAVALAAGASAVAVDVHGLENTGVWQVQPCSGRMRESAEQPTGEAAAHSMFAYPLESNFSGARYDAGVGDFLREDGAAGLDVPGSGRRWWVLLDAAKACSTQPPDLSRHKPDFVALSYYKIFGYPTGLGALLVGKEARQLLHKPYFGGGTVAACSADTAFVRRREGPAAFEDGTAHFLGIAALRHGFSLLRRLGGFPAIEAHTQALTRDLAAQLAGLRHFQGAPVCRLYGNHSQAEALPGAVGQGPVIALNLLRPDGSLVGYREVEKLAGLSGILLRGGCFCNPGACAAHLGLSAQDVRKHFEAGHVCWDDRDVVGGKATGAVRISFGFCSTRRDAAAVLDFVRTHFVASQPPARQAIPCPGPGTPRLAEIWVYPIKACRGCRQQEWPLGPNGLLYDREWALVGEDDQVLTLKKCPRLSQIQPRLDLHKGLMTVTAPGMPAPLTISLTTGTDTEQKASDAVRRIHICAESVCGMQVDSAPAGLPAASAWLSEAVGRPCTLVRQQAGSRWASRQGAPASAPIGFANEAQMLLVSQSSLDDLGMRLRGQQGAEVERFRPNLVIDGAPAFAEDGWRTVAVGERSLRVAGPCARCEVVCADLSDGLRRGPEPLLTLASYRRARGRINFGILLETDVRPGPKLCVGAVLSVR